MFNLSIHGDCHSLRVGHACVYWVRSSIFILCLCQINELIAGAT